jgi:hypothetical protein
VFYFNLGFHPLVYFSIICCRSAECQALGPLVVFDFGPLVAKLRLRSDQNLVWEVGRLKGYFFSIYKVSINIPSASGYNMCPANG